MRKLLSQKAPSEMFDWVLNAPLWTFIKIYLATVSGYSLFLHPENMKNFWDIGFICVNA